MRTRGRGLSVKIHVCHVIRCVVVEDLGFGGLGLFP